MPDIVMDLLGKRILVTGAASGIGRGAAKFFTRCGAQVLAADLDPTALSATWRGHPEVRTRAFDVVEEAQCEDAVAFAVKMLGGLDGVFHSAGISDVVASAIEIEIAQWQRIVDVNLRGTFLVARAAARHMLTLRHGSIVAISSVNGVLGIPRRHAYGPAKAAIAQLVRSLACEWGTSNIRVNTVTPTYVNTPMVDRLVREGKVDIDRLRRRTPLGRLAEVDDVVRAGAFLLSDWSRYITGVSLPVDGGWLAYGGAGDVATA